MEKGFYLFIFGKQVALVLKLPTTAFTTLSKVFRGSRGSSATMLSTEAAGREAYTVSCICDE
ncbi:MAG TPA: hypothetical protein DDZ51_08745 [Planctomycetaceae bacterium]|nr:hypothetical protein [Planctomycetaceae bacterium]